MILTGDPVNEAVQKSHRNDKLPNQAHTPPPPSFTRSHSTGRPKYMLTAASAPAR